MGNQLAPSVRPIGVLQLFPFAILILVPMHLTVGHTTYGGRPIHLQLLDFTDGEFVARAALGGFLLTIVQLTILRRPVRGGIIFPASVFVALVNLSICLFITAWGASLMLLPD